LEADAQLIQSCMRGDGSAWETLVKRHTQRVYGLCYRFTGNSAAAEDLSQEVFLRIYRTIESYRSDQGAFQTWLTSVTRNLLVDHYRRSRRDRLTDSMDDTEASTSVQVEAKRAPGHSPERLAHAAELSEQLQQALTNLSPELREAVILRDLQELDYREIQEVLQVPEGTVKSRINRGRIELARILESMGVQPLWGAQ
jgi:RNA polymerase sigma-70 factor, ECF subfamily